MYMSMLLSNFEFQRLCEAYRNIKVEKEDGIMCDLVQAYAEEYNR